MLVILFKKQPKTRDEQVNVIREFLNKEFENKFPTIEQVPNPCLSAVDPYEHAKSGYSYMELSRFVRTKDNSLIGFKTRCTSNFI